ncbi:MAG TPA: hypothetical protein VE870_02235 [Bacteroidales bacterium]|nr:hypothetical protein [Bacteroidales bacterium]
MRKIYIIFITIFSVATAWSQSPDMMSYQAVIRSSDGNLLTNTSVGIQVSILQGSTDGTAVYVERQFPQTNKNGLINIMIGGSEATVVSGDLAAIDWNNGPFFLKTETDPAGGSDYTIANTSQLLSVPYAFHSATAEVADNVPTKVSELDNDAGYLTSETDGSTTNELQNLDLTGTELSISDGNSVDFSSIAATHELSFPAFSLSKSASSTTFTEDARGLSWEATYAGGATLVIRKPENYNGGDVTFSLFFMTTTSTAGKVTFFIRPTSYNPGDGIFDPGSVPGTGVDVSGTTGFGSVYQQDITIPANRLSKDWWLITIQRGGTGETYSDPVVLHSVSLAY